jgi:alpha-D-ribose 1-methylphosphonate 5-triphosphate synthase subunit PhnI
VEEEEAEYKVIFLDAVKGVDMVHHIKLAHAILLQGATNLKLKYAELK